MASKGIPAQSATAILTSMVGLSAAQAGAIITPAENFDQAEPARTEPAKANP